MENQTETKPETRTENQPLAKPENQPEARPATAADRAAEAMRQSVAAKKPSVIQKVKQSGSLAGLTQGEIGDYLAGMKGRVARVLPRHLTPERVIQMAATTISRNPKIAECSPESLLGAVMQASILGFPPVDALGYCYFVPYSRAVQFQIGYKGFIELARRSGKVKSIYAEVVRQGDGFEVEFGLEPRLRHVPVLDPSMPLTHAYAVCHFSDGGHVFVVLSRLDIERLRLRNPSQRNLNGAWATDYDAMARAKALKQLAKYLPLNIDQAAAVATDGAVLSPESFADGQVKVEEAVYSIEG